MSDRKLISVPWNLAEITISKCRYFQPEKDLTFTCVLIRKNHVPPGGNLVIDVLTKQSYFKCKFKSKSVKYRLLNDTGPFRSCVTVAAIVSYNSPPLLNFLATGIPNLKLSVRIVIWMDFIVQTRYYWEIMQNKLDLVVFNLVKAEIIISNLSPPHQIRQSWWTVYICTNSIPSTVEELINYVRMYKCR